MKKYELTQEQINQLAEKKHAKELLQEFIPEAFENELEFGKWYISEHYLVYYLGNYKCNCIELRDGEWIENVYHSLSGHLKSYRLATEEEVVKALINEAIKRGFNNIGNLKIKNTFGGISNGFVTLTNDFYYDYKGNTLSLDCALIFNNGVWAEIIEEPKETEPTEEEIKRVLNYLLKNGEKLHNEI